MPPRPRPRAGALYLPVAAVLALTVGSVLQITASAEEVGTPAAAAETPDVTATVTAEAPAEAGLRAAAKDPKAPADEAACTPRTPTVEYVEAGAGPQDAFNAYAAGAGAGEWTGADSTYSVPLPDGRLLWIFSDTFLGPLDPGGTRPVTAPLVNNTFVIQDGGRFTTVTGGSPGAPSAVMPPSQAGHWFWAGDGMINGAGDLQVVYLEYRKSGDGFAFSRNVVATFDLGALNSPASVEALPSASGVAWGSALLPASASGDGYTYVYGVNDAPVDKKMRIARVHGSDLAQGAWEFWTPQGWTDDETAAGDALTGIANEYSVSPWSGQFLLVSQDSTVAASGRIDAYTSCSPAGPFERRTQVYDMPEPGPNGSYEDGDVVGYNAHAHPALSSGDSWLISYNVNSVDPRIAPDADNYRDPGIYRPRFFRVHFA